MSDKNDQFQKEVTWCIEQLRASILAMQGGKTSQKQLKECQRVLKVLTSSKAPLVKKRQAMHQMFGDYRKKIDSEEKLWEKDTLKQLRNMKISPEYAASPRGRFLKTAKSSSSVSSDSNSEPEKSFQIVCENEHVDANQENSDELSKITPSSGQIRSDLDKAFEFNFVIES